MTVTLNKTKRSIMKTRSGTYRFWKTILWFTILLIFTLLISGCTKPDPVETVIDGHIEHVQQTLDYAKANFEQTPSTVFLENELDRCLVAMVDIKQTYYGQISTCRAKTDYWRIATYASLVVLVGLIFALIRNILKVG